MQDAAVTEFHGIARRLLHGLIWHEPESLPHTHSVPTARQVLFVLAREDEEGDEEDELSLQPDWAASLAGFPSPEDAPGANAGEEGSDEWETDEGEGDDMDAEGEQVRLSTAGGSAHRVSINSACWRQGRGCGSTRTVTWEGPGDEVESLQTAVFAASCSARPLPG